MSLQDEYVAAQDPSLQARVQSAICTAAQNISTEDPSTPNHYNRASLGQAVSRAPENWRTSFVYMLTSEGITSASSDLDISNMVSAVWNTVAGPPLPTA